MALNKVEICGVDTTKLPVLKEEEKIFLYDYFQMLGKGDSISQKTYFSSVQQTLSKWKESSNQEGKKYEDLYIKLGFLCGLFVLILII